MKLSLLLLCIVPFSLTFAQQWQQTATSPKGSGITDLAVNQLSGNLFAATGSFNFPSGDSGGVHRSTDQGDTWTQVFPAFVARSIAMKSDGSVFASVWDWPVTDESLYRSTDDGDTWELAFNAGASNNIFSIAFDSVSSGNPDVAYAGSRVGVHRSLSGGLPGTWTLQTQGLPSTPWIRDLVVAPNGVLIAAVMNTSNSALNGVYYSTDQGENFVQAPGIASGDTVSSLMVFDDSTTAGAADMTRVLAGTERGRVYSAAVLVTGIQSFALLFTFPGTPGLVAFVLAIIAGLIFVALYPTFGSGGGVAYSTAGLSWTFLLAGLSILLLISAIAYHRYMTDGGEQYTMYSGEFLNQNDGAPVYRIDLATALASDPTGIPEEFSLNQNYPNPFNPTTTIQFDITQRSQVKLTVYDLLGREVEMLIDEVLDPGSFNISWDAADHPTGVYFYRLSTDQGVQTRRLMVLR